jgi:hypothetical protein
MATRDPAGADPDPGVWRPARLGLDPCLEAAGIDLAGVLAPAAYDAHVPAAWRQGALLPEARAVALLACGGRAFGDALRAAHPGGLASARDPVERFTRAAVESAAARLREAGFAARAAFAWERRGGDFADFVALARACGLGEPSRLGLLLHPVYGPWLALRALLLTSKPLAPTPPLADFDPCTGCPAPCADACPGAAVAPGGFDALACAHTRRRLERCAERCDARHACVVGTQHAYAADVEAHHMRHVPKIDIPPGAPHHPASGRT